MMKYGGWERCLLFRHGILLTADRYWLTLDMTIKTQTTLVNECRAVSAHPWLASQSPLLSPDQSRSVTRRAGRGYRGAETCSSNHTPPRPCRRRRPRPRRRRRCCRLPAHRPVVRPADPQTDRQGVNRPVRLAADCRRDAGCSVPCAVLRAACRAQCRVPCSVPPVPCRVSR